MLKSKKSYLLPDYKKLDRELKKRKLKVSKKTGLLKTRNKYAYKIGIGVLLLASVFITYNVIRASQKNAAPGTMNNFDPEYTITDNNGNDIIFNENGSIVVDPIEDYEKEILVNNINNTILADLSNRSPEEIQNIDQILSITQIPYNQNETDNHYDQYFLTVLFKANDKIYALNYITGDTFETESDDPQKYIGDFLSFLKNCALDMCVSMSDEERQFIDTVGDDKIMFVMPYYIGYDASGETTYFIPVFYNDNGNIYVDVHYTLANNLDAYWLNPLEELARELKGESENKFFNVQRVNQNDELNNVSSSYTDFKNDMVQITEDQNVQLDENNKE